jgi:hypothetical protein
VYICVVFVVDDAKCIKQSNKRSRRVRENILEN